VDVRIVAATHRDLQHLIKIGHFREDLFFRLSVFTIDLPRLDERRDDIPTLVRYFIARGNRRHGREVAEVPDETMDRLTRHQWRGNVRELENVIDRALIVSNGPTLLPESITFAHDTITPKAAAAEMDDASIFDAIFERLCRRFADGEGEPILSVIEREMLNRALSREDGNQVQAAKLLGMSRQTLRNRLISKTDLDTPGGD
jgi:two-component system nitrogen regulation response regulator GlnG